MTRIMTSLGSLMLGAHLCFAANVFAACSDDDPALPLPETPATQPDNESTNTDNETIMKKDILITVGDTHFSATLADTEAARAFASRLPLTLHMSELNGNEKYCYVDEGLPTQASRFNTIHAGDLMLYGSSCIVLFYETFSSGYSYTRLGTVEHAEALATALGRGDVTVQFASGGDAE